MKDLYNKPDKACRVQQLKAFLANSGDECRRLESELKDLRKQREDWNEELLQLCNKVGE